MLKYKRRPRERCPNRSAAIKIVGDVNYITELLSWREIPYRLEKNAVIFDSPDMAVSSLDWLDDLADIDVMMGEFTLPIIYTI